MEEEKQRCGAERIQEVEEEGLHSHSQVGGMFFLLSQGQKSQGGENYLHKDDSSCNQVFLGGYGAGSHSHLSEAYFGDLIIAFAHWDQLHQRSKPFTECETLISRVEGPKACSFQEGKQKWSMTVGTLKISQSFWGSRA